MDNSLSEVIKNIPDFEEFMKLTDEIRDMTLKKLLIEKELRAKEANIFRTAMSDEKYFVNGKPPAISYIDSAYKFSGFNDELLKARHELVEVTAELDHLKLTMSVYKDMLDIFRTLSANERGVSL